jgi:hypothetical protein
MTVRSSGGSLSMAARSLSPSSPAETWLLGLRSETSGCCSTRAVSGPSQVKHVIPQDVAQPRSELGLGRSAKGGQIAQGLELSRLHDVGNGEREMGLARDLFVRERPQVRALPLQQSTNRFLRPTLRLFQQIGQTVFRRKSRTIRHDGQLRDRKGLHANRL